MILSFPFLLSPCSRISWLALTRNVKIRKLDGAEIGPEPCHLLSNVIGQELAVHALECPVQTCLDVEITLVLARLLGSLLLLGAALVVGLSFPVDQFGGHGCSL